MANFRGTVQGNREETSRLGTKDSGMRATVNGWKSGIRIRAYFDRNTGTDVFEVYLTRGSKQPDIEHLLLGEIRTDIEGNAVFILAGDITAFELNNN